MTAPSSLALKTYIDWSTSSATCDSEVACTREWWRSTWISSDCPTPRFNGPRLAVLPAALEHSGGRIDGAGENVVRPRISKVSRVRGSTFLGLLLLMALLAAKAHAQQPAKVHQIGYLIYGSPASVAHRTEALRAGLRDLGYVEGKNITIEFRSAETTTRLPEVAA